jgi:hypothetical protein
MGKYVNNGERRMRMAIYAAQNGMTLTLLSFDLL